MGLQAGLAVAGMVFSAYSAVQQSKAQKSQYEYQAAVDRNNAQIQRWQAEDAVRRGNIEADNKRREIAALKGKQVSSMAAKGLDLNSGSAFQLITDTDLLGGQDIQDIKTNAAREAWAYRTGANNSELSANLADARADAESPLLAGATSLLTDAPTVAGKWYSGTSVTPEEQFAMDNPSWAGVSGASTKQSFWEF